MQWKHASSTSPQKFKLQASTGKIMCTIFSDAEGVLPHIATVTECYYAELLYKLLVAIKDKCPATFIFA